MGLQDNDTAVDQDDMPEPPGKGSGKEIKSPPVPPGANLNQRERKVWDYICRVLRDAGMPHITAGLAIAVVCRTFIRWVDAELRLRELEATTGTYFVTTPNGHQQPHQVFYVAAGHKKELLQWLPESCLTLPATVTTRAKLGDEGVQDDLFADLWDHGIERVAPKSTSTH
jgi:hypothetical protein